MQVDLDSVELHIEMLEAFGLPTPADPQMKEAFGWYHCGTGEDEGPKYWFFDPSTTAWSVNKGGSRLTPFPYSAWCDADRIEAGEKQSQLSMMAPPQKPADVSVPAQSSPFLYEGWLFAWFFFPELKRWELAPLERR
jgi:hypothetical protein